MILLIAVSSCEEDGYNLLVEQRNSQNDLRLLSGEERAIQALDKFVNRADDKATTRGAMSGKVVKVEKKTTASYSGNMLTTRALDLSLPVYELTLLNDDNSSGFAVVAETPAESKVMAYAPKGSIADTVYNKGLANFFREFAYYTEATVENTKINSPTSRDNIWQNNWNYYYFYKVLNSKEYVRDLNQDEIDNDAPGFPYTMVDYSTTIGKIIPAAWNQTSPYNNNVPFYVTGTNDHVRVGCFAVALGQVMSYYKNDSNYNWDLLTKTSTIKNNTSAATEVAKLLRDISIEAGTVYDENKNLGSTNVDNVASTILHFGLNVRQKNLYSDSCIDSVSYNLAYDHPVLIIGNNDIIGEKQEAHIWVIDAMITQRWWNYYVEEVHSNYPPYTRFAVSRDKYEGKLVHCNWGWGGSSNGWYCSFYPIYANGHQLCLAYNKIIYTQIYPK